MNAPFRTRVVRSCDYRNFDLTPFAESFEVDEDLILEGFRYIQKKFAQREEVQDVAAGDAVTISCVSQLPKFNKSAISLNVGRGLYSRELETQLIGMKVGQCRDCMVSDTPVQVTVLDSRRVVDPVIDDAFVNSHFPGLHTVEDLRQWYRDDQRAQFVDICTDKAAQWLTEQVISGSEFEVDAQELAVARKTGEESIRQMMAASDIDLDTISDEQAQEMFGHPSVQAYIDWFGELCQQDVYTAALGFAEKQAAGEDLTEEDYARELATLLEESPAPEETKKTYTFEVWARQKCSEFYTDLLKNHVNNHLKEKIL